MIGNCLAHRSGPAAAGSKLTVLRSVVAFGAAVLIAFTPRNASAVSDARDYAVLVSANVQSAPAQISLNWPQDTFAEPVNYVVSRKLPSESNWVALGTLSGSETNFVDTNVVTGIAYEYEVQKNAIGYVGYGYVMAGMETPLVESRGTLLLMVDNTYATDLAAELNRLQQDLVGDGWQVIRHDVARDAAPQEVKALIQSDYLANPTQVRSVFLFGHVPVPYSGDLGPDGHPDHRGAWPSDVYYGDVDTDWSDASLTSTNAFDARNWNVPGDGKFDVSSVSTVAELEVGRVDLANLPSFALPERELLRQYLNKDHNFRHKIVTAQPRGLVCDYFGVSSGSAFAATGWRNFAAFFGASNVVASGSWFGTLANDSYLWAYGCGGGTFNSASGIGTTADFAANDPHAVFTFLFGSYFGDWDSTDNFMRAALATPTYTLTSAWAGRPHWFVHQMALGGTIGASTRLSQNNSFTGPYKQIAAGTMQAHVALMGDPALRMHPVAPVADVTTSENGGRVTLTWTPSAEEVLGYFVYRAENAAGPFTRVSESLVTDATFTDAPSTIGEFIYMVRAVKLETSASGSYYNASQGVFASATVTSVALNISAVADRVVELGTQWTFATPTASGGCGSVAVNFVGATTNCTSGNCFVAKCVWQAADACGATVLATNVVTVVDTTAPTLSVTTSRTVEADTAWTFDAPTATDLGGNVSIAVVAVVTNASVVTQTWSATDPSGNIATASQSITIASAKPPTVTIVANATTIAEGASAGSYEISRSGRLSEALTVALVYSGTAKSGVDYVALPASVIIPAGVTSVTLVLTPISDSSKEKSETVIATIRSSSSYQISNPNSATIKIEDAPKAAPGKKK